MRRIIFVLLGTCMAWQGFAQPAVRRNQAQNSNAASAQPKATDRASLMFPVTQELPSDAAWRRDIYRELDLTKDKNAALYYPVEPTGGRMNLITYLFRLLSDGRIQAYEYKLNGRESFASADKIDVKEIGRASCRERVYDRV